MLEPVQYTDPVGGLPQCSLPLVNVGVFVDLRQNASPVLVCWCTSPVPFGSGNSHVIATPIGSPTIAFRSAKPSTNCGD
jgi:hypothetical protein